MTDEFDIPVLGGLEMPDLRDQRDATAARMQMIAGRTGLFMPDEESDPYQQVDLGLGMDAALPVYGTEESNYWYDGKLPGNNIPQLTRNTVDYQSSGRATSANDNRIADQVKALLEEKSRLEEFIKNSPLDEDEATLTAQTAAMMGDLNDKYLGMDSGAMTGLANDRRNEFIQREQQIAETLNSITDAYNAQMDTVRATETNIQRLNGEMSRLPQDPQYDGLRQTYKDRIIDMQGQVEQGKVTARRLLKQYGNFDKFYRSRSGLFATANPEGEAEQAPVPQSSVVATLPPVQSATPTQTVEEQPEEQPTYRKVNEAFATELVGKAKKAKWSTGRTDEEWADLARNAKDKDGNTIDPRSAAAAGSSAKKRYDAEEAIGRENVEIANFNRFIDTQADALAAIYNALLEDSFITVDELRSAYEKAANISEGIKEQRKAGTVYSTIPVVGEYFDKKYSTKITEDSLLDQLEMEVKKLRSQKKAYKK